ncbi:MAG TPA: LysM peptidoglycan-binding domain-containing protein [Solirubrobacteraceae bacterium]|nr:LysM peptidoglycan-binding domain-containing protein [Solirubrobacteraceae bacterium]
MRFRILAGAAVVVALGIAPSAASASFVHVVGAGETLSSVAAADGLSISALAAANGLDPSAQLIAGQSLAIPPRGAATAAAPRSVASGSSAPAGTTESVAEDVGESETSSPGPSGPSAPAGGYLVQPGDTLSAIAAAHGLSVGQLAAINGLDPSGLLISGHTLSFGSGVATPAATPVATTVPATSTAAGAQPTTQTVSASTVGSIAAANGVSPSLAEAIGWQESGFNNGLTSATGATGVMQIEPYTWSYINHTLATPPPLSPASAFDNIRGGVLLLHSLLAQTGGDPAMAAAGYYQGLDSVRRHGLYADTQRYVDNVMALRSRFGGG